MKAIIFDFDGTLADTAPGIVNTMQETFRRMQLPVPTDAQVRLTIGLQLVKAIQLLGNVTPEEAAHGVEIYSNIFEQYEVPRITIFPHILNTLAQLQQKGIRMAICTSRDKLSLQMICNSNGLTPYIETCITNNDHLKPKPNPDMVLTLLSRMQISADEALVVGDTTFDIEMGNSAGCRTVAVTYGNHSHERLLTAKPTYIIDNFAQMTDIIQF